MAAICVVAFGLRVLYVYAFTSHLHFGLDTVWYELVAGTLADGKGFVDPAKFYGHGVAVSTAFRPPLYPVFLAAVAKTFGGSRTDYQLAGCVCGAVTVGLIGHLARKVGGEIVGLTAAGVAAVSPALIGMDASVMAETIYIPLIACTLIAIAGAFGRPNLIRWGIAGAVAGLATLARGDGALVVVLVVMPAAFIGSSRSGRWRLAAVGASLLGALIVIAPWIVRNEIQLHRPTIATLDAGTALAGANCHSTYYGSKLGSWDDACAQVAYPNAMSELQLTDELQQRGLHFVLSHAPRVPVVVAARVARQWGLWNPVSEARLEAVESRNTRWQLISWMFDSVLLVLAAVGFVIRRRDRLLLPLMFLIGAVTVDAALVYGKQRFQAAALPAIVVLAAIAIVTFIRRNREARADAT